MRKMNSLFKEIPNVNSMIQSVIDIYPIDNHVVLKECIDVIYLQLRESIKNNSINTINEDQLQDILNNKEIRVKKNKDVDLSYLI